MWALALIPVGGLTTVECLYRLALPPASLLPPRPVGTAVPPVIARALWVAWEPDSEPMHVQPQGPWTLGRWVASFVVKSRGSLRSPDGSRLAHAAASLWSAPPREAGRPRLNGLKRFALGIWMTREWSAEELVSFHAEQMRVGPRAQGMWAASHVYLGREWARLDAADAALLVAVAHSPSSHSADPWCHPEPALARRGRLLRVMRRQGLIDEQALEAALRAPLRLAPRPGTRPPCPREPPAQQPR